MTWLEVRFDAKFPAVIELRAVIEIELGAVTAAAKDSPPLVDATAMSVPDSVAPALELTLPLDRISNLAAADEAALNVVLAPVLFRKTF